MKAASESLKPESAGRTTSSTHHAARSPLLRDAPLYRWRICHKQERCRLPYRQPRHRAGAGHPCNPPTAYSRIFTAQPATLCPSQPPTSRYLCPTPTRLTLPTGSNLHRRCPSSTLTPHTHCPSNTTTPYPNLSAPHYYRACNPCGQVYDATDSVKEDDNPACPGRSSATSPRPRRRSPLLKPPAHLPDSSRPFCRLPTIRCVPTGHGRVAPRSTLSHPRIQGYLAQKKRPPP